MRLLLLLLLLACIAIQYPLWKGDSGWLRVAELKQQLQEQHEKNKALLARNNAMKAEVQDLESGSQALEDRARIEMGMINEGEVLVQILVPNEAVPTVSLPIGKKTETAKPAATPTPSAP
ncbi:cell division protein FtsB [Advenella sp. RU8]|uniref:cell division protein FtsB n=1 Tax=Advenella sp. RU8 TaxID=3399575 RepID=UPI003AAF971B